MTLGAVNTYSGGTIVNGGTLALAVGGQSGTLQGPLTINPGATVFCAVNNALGYGGNNWVQNITINGGNLSTGVTTDNGWGETITMTAGTISSTVAGGYFAFGEPAGFTSSPTINVLASNAPAVISSGVANRGDNTNPGIVLNVTRGSAASDLVISGSIFSTNGSTGITVNGNGITVLTGSNTYTGATNLNGGTLQLGTGVGQDGSISNTSGVTDNWALVFDLAGTQTAAYAISGTGTLTMDGPGLFVLQQTARTRTTEVRLSTTAS